MQPDGKILIGGFSGRYNGVNRGNVARLNTDGSLDTSFLARGEGTDSSVHAVAVLPGGKIPIGGSFTKYNGVRRDRVARLNSDGSLDTSFLTSGRGAGGSWRDWRAVLALAVQPGGRILIGGTFTSYAGVPRGRLAMIWD